MNFKQFVFIFTLLSFNCCKQGSYHLTKIEGKQLLISNELSNDSLVENFIKPYREHINSAMDSILSYAPETYSKKDGLYNTAIGNLMADIVYEQSNPIFEKRTAKKIDAVLLNYGGIRSIISKGEITVRTAYQIMPFENSIVIVALKGKQVLEIINFLSKSKKAHPINGIQLVLDKNGQTQTALIHKKPIDELTTYYIATNDYLYNGGDKMSFFIPNDSVYNLDYKIRNAMIDFFRKTDTIKPKIDNRFIQLK